jgi:uncharacterized NTF2-like protein DUF6841
VKPQAALTVPGQAGIISEIREHFQDYGPTFVDLAIGRRSDVDALLEFYGAPLRFVGSTFHLVMQDSAAITGPAGMGGEIERLRRTGFAGSTLDKFEVSVLNSRAALVDALWLRCNRAGAQSRFAVIYLVTLTADGWRITSAVSTSE